jgi:hypothetical protein
MPTNCDNRFRTQSKARRAVDAITAPDGWRSVVRFCEDCRGWHVVFVPGRERGSDRNSQGDPQGMCYQKKCDTSVEFARQVVRHVYERRRTLLRAYQCSICGYYHVTKREEWQT